MRQKLVFLAVACLIALPLAAASHAPVQNQTEVPAVAASAQQAAAPMATPSCASWSPLAESPITTLAVGQCTTSSQCTLYCEELYGTSYATCVNFRCWCAF